MNSPIHKKFALTIVTDHSETEHTFWFGRIDMKDNLRPVKVIAPTAHEAWNKLEELEKQKCSTSSSSSVSF